MGKAQASLAAIAPYKWEPGKSANPAGRPKGARSKLSELTLQALLADFEQHGAEVIERVRQKRPETYLSAVVSLLPKQQERIESPLVDLTDSELDQLEALLAGIRAKTVSTIEAAAGPAPQPAPEPELPLTDTAA